MTVETPSSDSAKYIAIDQLGSNILNELLAAANIPQGASPVGFRVLRDKQDDSQIHVEILCSLDGAPEPRGCVVQVDIERLVKSPSRLLRKILEKLVVQ